MRRRRTQQILDVKKGSIIPTHTPRIKEDNYVHIRVILETDDNVLSFLHVKGDYGHGPVTNDDIRRYADLHDNHIVVLHRQKLGVPIRLVRNIIISVLTHRELCAGSPFRYVTCNIEFLNNQEHIKTEKNARRILQICYKHKLVRIISLHQMTISVNWPSQ